MRSAPPPALLLLVLPLAACRTPSPSVFEVLDEQRTPAERAYDWTLGRWTGVRRAASDGSEEPVVLRVEPVLGGVGQRRAMEIRHARGTYRGLAVQVYDPDAGHWVRQYVNGVRRTFARLEGGPDASGVRSEWRSTTPGRTADSRVDSERLGPDRWRRTVSRSTDGGTTWSEVFTDELVRR